MGLRRGRWAVPVHRHQARLTALGLEEAHRQFRISPAEFDEVAAELARSLDAHGVPGGEKHKVLDAFAAHKGEVNQGSSVAVGA